MAGSEALSFVGLPSSALHLGNGLRGNGLRTPEVAMHFSGGDPLATGSGANLAWGGAAVCAVATAAGLARRTKGRKQRETRLRVATAANESAAAKGGKDVAPPPPPPFDPAKQLGAMAPMGYFDPLGFSKVGDEAGFRNLRAAELKHGRVAMMAAVGGVAQHYIKFPGFDTVPSGMGAVTAAPGTY